MSRQKEEEIVPVTIHVRSSEKKRWRILAGELGKSLEWVLRGAIRVGEEISTITSWKYIAGEYDRPDIKTMHECGEPDLDWIREEVLKLSEDVSLLVYQERLEGTKEACDEVVEKAKQAIRIAEIKKDVISEEMDKVEHLIEEET